MNRKERSVWRRVAVIDLLPPHLMYEHTPLNLYRYGEYPRFQRPPRFEGRSELRRVRIVPDQET